MHTKPEDADGIIGNITPVTYDVFWLTSLLLYGGKKDVFRKHLSYRLEGFHGLEKYLDKYYLLLIANSNRNFNIPSTKLQRLKKEEMVFELSELYEFCNSFSTDHINRLLEVNDTLISESEIWDPLFKGKARQSFESVKEWLNKTKKDLSDLRNQIEIILEPDKKKIDECINKITNYYKEKTVASYFAEIYEKKDSDIEKYNLFKMSNVPKNCFLKKSLTSCDNLWYQFGETIVNKEKLYFISEINKNKKIDIIRPTNKNIKEIISSIKVIINQLKDKDLQPLTIIVPLRMLQDIIKNQELLDYDSKGMNLKFENLKVRLLPITENDAFNDLLIICKGSINISFKLSESSERLNFKFEFNDEKPEVELNIDEHIKLELLNTSGLKIIKI